MASDKLLIIVLRFFGTSSLLALIFVAAPYSWMNSIHAWLGLGTLPDEPVVGYLARSTSAFYAILGGLFWIVSFNVKRHRQILIYLGSAITLFGIALIIVDWSEGLPVYWALWEGPFVMVLGLTIGILSKQICEE